MLKLDPSVEGLRVAVEGLKALLIGAVNSLREKDSLLQEKDAIIAEAAAKAEEISAKFQIVQDELNQSKEIGKVYKAQAHEIDDKYWGLKGTLDKAVMRETATAAELDSANARTRQVLVARDRAIARGKEMDSECQQWIVRHDIVEDERKDVAARFAALVRSLEPPSQDCLPIADPAICPECNEPNLVPVGSKWECPYCGAGPFDVACG